MKKITIPMLKIVVVASAFAVLTSTVRANVYATDIQINGTLTGTVSTIPTPVSPATITYHLNEAATAGCTVNILRGSTTVATIAGGTNQGLNAVRWGGTNNSGGVAGIGTFSVSITTAATGFPTWQQTSPLSTNTAMVLVHGLAVDKNTNSPYYGRIMAGCAISSSGTANGVTQKTGIYKFNADFTPADEGNYGYGGYTTDDAGNTAVGQMPSDGYGDIPYRLQVGDDDRLYMLDWTGSFAVIAFDMQVTTNQIVINESGYSGNPYFSSINAANFDVPQAGTTNATVWMYNNAFNTFGVWYWHVLPSTGQADPSDTVGNWAVTCDNGVSPVSLLPSGGGQIDLNNNIFVSEYRLNLGDGSLRTMVFTNWDSGSLYPSNPTGDEAGQVAGEIQWGIGSADNTMTGVENTILNSRYQPTLVAAPMDGYGGTDNNVPGGFVTTTPAYSLAGTWNGGIRLLNALNAVPTITSVSVSGTNLIINFTSSSPWAPVLSDLSTALWGSSTVNGTYAPVTATITGSNGVFHATTAVSGPIGYYIIVFPPTGGTVVSGSAVSVDSSADTTPGNVTSLTLSNIDIGNWYNDAAFDNVGNLYGAAISDSYIRVWSPPGANTNTTVAVVTLTELPLAISPE